MPAAAYAELRRQASALLRRERVGHTLQTTALAHEAYLRLAQQRSVPWSAADQFAVAAAVTIRRVLVDHARADKTLKRGHGRRNLQIDASEIADTRRPVDLVELDDCLTRLEALHPRQARVVDLRVFAGLPIERISELLGVSEPTVGRDWRWARTWLRRELDRPDTDPLSEEGEP